MTKSEGTVKTFVTFRIAGDNLVPDDVTKLLKVIPAHAHKKGEAYSTGRSNLVAATGVWLFGTDRIITSSDFHVHLNAALLLLGFLPNLGFSGGNAFDVVANALKLKSFLEAKSLTATMTLFWHGQHNAEFPLVPREIVNLFDLIPIEIEHDFDRDEEAPSRRHKVA